MKAKVLFFCISLFCILSISVKAQFTQNEFIIGAFVGPDIQGVTDAVAIQRFQQVRDAHFNLIAYPFHLYDSEYPSGTIFSEAYNDRSISISSQVGLKYLVNDTRHMPAAFWNQSTPLSTFSSTIASQMVNHYQNLNTFAAIYGYSLKDEPSPSNINSSHLSYLRNYVNYIKTNQSQKLAYINLLPYYAFTTKTAYESYLNDYLLSSDNNQRPSVFGFDYYLESDPISITNYFYNLSIIRTKAQGRPFWSYPRVSTLNDGSIDADLSYIRFGVYSALAYGSKGLIYYCYETRLSNTALASDGITTTKYTWVQGINNYIENVIGPAIMSSHCIGTFHKSDFKNNSGTVIETITSSEKIANSPFVTDLSHDQAMVGEFFDESNNIVYLLIVNKGYNNNFSAITTTVELPGNLTGKIFTTSTTGNPNWNYTSVNSSFSNNFTYFTVSNLQPGEGRLYKVIDSGLGKWDWSSSSSIFGNVNSIPVPADYDGDNKTDLSIKNSSGQWKIDYANNGFGTWDATYNVFGDASNIPIPEDYDGDGKADLAVKNNLGEWKIDRSNNGFNGIDVTYTGWGDATNHPVPADYDGDGKADLSIKNDAGQWKIDRSNNGFGTIDEIYPNYGAADAHPVPADYDGDGKADLSVKADWGNWYINYASNGFSLGWELIISGYGDASNLPIPADYDGDGKADLSVKNSLGEWKVDFSDNGFSSWDDLNYQYGSTDAHPITGDYNGDGKYDFSIKTDGGSWFIDYAGYKLRYLNKKSFLSDEQKPKILDSEISISNFPNPFNPSTVISYNVNNPDFVVVKIFDILGKEIKSFDEGFKNKGRYSVLFDGANLSSGTYFYQLKVGNQIKNGKMLLTK